MQSQSNSTNNKKVIIIGKKDVINCFKFLGFETYPVLNEKDVKNVFESLKPKLAHDKSGLDELGIIFITEDLFENLKEEIQKLSDRTTPAVVLIPDNTGSKNIAAQMMKKTIEQATGSDILSK